MAEYIFEDKVMQGRAKNILGDKIFMLFTKSMGEDKGKIVRISYNFDPKTKEHFFKRS